MSRHFKISLIILAAVILALCAWPIVKNNAYSISREEAQKTLEHILASTDNPPLSVVHTSVVDDGCIQRAPLLGYSVGCELIADQIYKAKNLRKNITELDKRLTDTGYSTTASIDPTTSDFKSPISYVGTNPRVRLQIHVEPPKEAQPQNGYIKQFVEDGRIAPLDDGESHYSIRADYTYWSCSRKYVFSLPCPTPPSDPR